MRFLEFALQICNQLVFVFKPGPLLPALLVLLFNCPPCFILLDHKVMLFNFDGFVFSFSQHLCFFRLGHIHLLEHDPRFCLLKVVFEAIAFISQQSQLLLLGVALFGEFLYFARLILNLLLQDWNQVELRCHVPNDRLVLLFHYVVLGLDIQDHVNAFKLISGLPIVVSFSLGPLQALLVQ